MNPVVVVPQMEKMSNLQNAWHEGTRIFDFTQCQDFDWDIPLCLDDIAHPSSPGDMPSVSFSIFGAGSLHSVLHRTYKGDQPALYSKSTWITPFNIQGVTWIENAGNSAPMVSFAYSDRWLWHNASVMGGNTAMRGLELGVGGTLTARQLVQGFTGPDIPVQGLTSEFHIGGRSEFLNCGGEGLYAYGARNFSIGDRTSFERNARINKDAPEVLLEANPDARCGHGIFANTAFENDYIKQGLVIRGNFQGMFVGHNRHVLAGMDAECYDSSWAPSIAYDAAPMTRRGSSNKWVGRKQILTGPWYNKKLVDEPEELFDLRLQYDSSGT